MTARDVPGFYGFFLRLEIVAQETKGRFRKSVVLANVPSFRFSFRGQHPNVPSFRLSFRGNIRQNHPFGNPPFCQPPKPGDFIHILGRHPYQITQKTWRRRKRSTGENSKTNPAETAPRSCKFLSLVLAGFEDFLETDFFRCWGASGSFRAATGTAAHLAINPLLTAPNRRLHT